MRKLSCVDVSMISQEDRIHSRSSRGNLIQEMVYECCQGIRSTRGRWGNLGVITTGSLVKRLEESLLGLENTRKGVVLPEPRSIIFTEIVQTLLMLLEFCCSWKHQRPLEPVAAHYIMSDLLFSLYPSVLTTNWPSPQLLER